MKFSGWLLLLLIGFPCVAQVAIDNILEADLTDARRFSKDYFNAAAEGAINSTSNGWYTTAETKGLFEFEIGFVGNLSFVRDDKKSFVLNENNYDNLSFITTETRRLVANSFGQNSEDITMLVTSDSGGSFEITLPNGLNGEGINTIPTTYLQGSMGLVKGLELKLRFMPKLKNGEATKVSIVGSAIQSDLSKWIFAMKRWPVSVSGIVGYTSLRAEHDLSSQTNLEGDSQEILFRSNSWLFSGIVSTKREGLNFYGGFGFFAGTSLTEIKGTYQVTRGSFAGTTLEDPLDVENKESGLKATLGTSYAYKKIKANLDYTLQNYSNLSLGLAFHW